MNVVGHDLVLWRLQNTFIWLDEFEGDAKEKSLSERCLRQWSQIWWFRLDANPPELAQHKEKKKNLLCGHNEKKKNPAGTSLGSHDNEVKLIGLGVWKCTYMLLQASEVSSL